MPSRKKGAVTYTQRMMHLKLQGAREHCHSYLFQWLGWAPVPPCDVICSEAHSKESKAPPALGIHVHFLFIWTCNTGVIALPCLSGKQRRLIRQHTKKQLCCSHMKYSVQIDPAVHQYYSCYWPPKYPNPFIQVSELPSDIFTDITLFRSTLKSWRPCKMKNKS